MKKLLTVSALLAAMLSTSASGTEMTSGLVKKVDEKQLKVTIKHEPLKNLDMGAMTMVFAVKDATMLPKFKPGTKIKFTAERVNGKLTVTEVQ